MMKPQFALVLVMLANFANGATIYECRAYTGSSFFSTGVCGQHKAVGVMLHTVPDGMSFEQQVRIVENAKSKKLASAQNEESNRLRLGECAQIDSELQELQKKHTNWEYVPIDQVNVDQGRERDLKSRRSQLRCYAK